MRTGVLVINFGEPERAREAEVIPFLERIFLTNAGLEGRMPDEAARARSRELARARAGGLVAVYEQIGGSPLNAQARAQAEQLEAELARRGHDARCYPVFQFLEPGVQDGVRRAREEGVTRLVALPVYPLCGESTTIAALEEASREVEALGWDVPLLQISGWHRHPDYLPFHAEHTAASCQDAGVDLSDPETRLLFSIHGTPTRYLYQGSRYDRYVDEFCAGLAERLGVRRYSMGYQNHTNRPIEWTEPGVETVVERLEARRVVVVSPSFMHEQSETLAELDVELRERVEARGMDYFRVPVPHDHPRFGRILADLVEEVGGEGGGRVDWRRCMCRGRSGTFCTNGMRLDGLEVQVPPPA